MKYIVINTDINIVNHSSVDILGVVNIEVNPSHSLIVLVVKSSYIILQLLKNSI